MDHGGQRVLGRDRGEHPGEGVAVGGVARRHVHPRAERGQVGDQLGRPRSVAAPAAEQQQSAHSAFGHQVAGQQRTEGPGAAGDQHRPLGGGRQADTALGLAGPACPDQARQQSGATAQRDLGVARGRLGEDRLGARVGVGVQQDEAAGVLGLRGADHAPDGGGGEVADLLGRIDRDGVRGEEDQAGVSSALVGQPAAQQLKDAPGGVVHPGRR